MKPLPKQRAWTDERQKNMLLRAKSSMATYQFDLIGSVGIGLKPDAPVLVVNPWILHLD
jgi:hypothetical protein